MQQRPLVSVYIGEELATYGFGNSHPFGPERMTVFWQEVTNRGLDSKLAIRDPVLATEEELTRFHGSEYIKQVKLQSVTGEGYLDCGDTPAFIGVYEAASYVVGTSLAAAKSIMEGQCQRAFVPIAGLHHARRNSAAGFCVFNDCGVVIETLKSVYGLTKIAYIDIDAHHGDGVFYSFEADPQVVIADIHEDGRFLYPGTGAVHETGKGPAKGSKLNIPVLPDSSDEKFFKCWVDIEKFIRDVEPEFIILQCGADSIAGDPLTHLKFSAQAHQFAAKRLCNIADKYSNGRILAMGGGGYNHTNIAEAWANVLAVLIED